jgi:hypothetical protein
VAAHSRSTGTHQGEFFGVPASGKAVEWQDADIWRFSADGKVVEYWNYVDMLALMQQMGAVPEHIADTRGYRRSAPGAGPLRTAIEADQATDRPRSHPRRL